MEGVYARKQREERERELYELRSARNAFKVFIDHFAKEQGSQSTSLIRETYYDFFALGDTEEQVRSTDT